MRQPAWFIAAGAIVGLAAGLATVALSDDDAPAPAATGPTEPTPTATVPASPTAVASPSPAATPLAEPHVEAVVSAHELATEAGMGILDQGGTAADGLAVAVAAALTVVEPWYSSALGGGTWGLYYDARGNEVTSLDGVGPTGSNASVAAYSAIAGQPGMHQAITPGAWDGWMLWLQRYGSMDLRDVLQPAIDIARDGYTIDAQLAMFLGRNPEITARPDTAAIWAPGGAVLGEGDTVYQDDLADTFEALAGAYDEALPDGRDAAIQAARDYYYRGPLAEAIVAFSDANGGYLTLDDFASFEAAIVDPISIDWDDEITVYQNPPNSQGITQLIALNILKGMGLDAYAAGDSDAVHLQIEAIKLAFADRFHHVGDPARVDVPVGQLLSAEHAGQQRARIDMGSAMQWPIADGLELAQASHSTSPGGTDTGLLGAGDTSTFHIVDSDGNGASVTTSLGSQFYVVGDTGIHVNNRMRFLSLGDGNPNQLAPGYKVRHTSNPYMALRDGQLYMLGGNTGADTQAQAQVQQFLNVVAFGLSAQEAVDRPRFIVMSFPSTIYPHAAANILRMETAFPGALGDALGARGHAVQWLDGDSYGNAGLIVLDEDGHDAQVGVESRNRTSSGLVEPAP